DPQPGFGWHLRVAADQFLRVGAVHTVQRAPVGDLGEHGHRGAHGGRIHSTHPFWTAWPRNSTTSARSSAPGYFDCSIPISPATVCVPSHNCRISAAVSLSRTARSGSRRTYRCRTLSKRILVLPSNLGRPTSSISASRIAHRLAHARNPESPI